MIASPTGPSPQTPQEGPSEDHVSNPVLWRMERGWVMFGVWYVVSYRGAVWKGGELQSAHAEPTSANKGHLKQIL